MKKENKYTEIPIINTPYSLIIIHDESWTQDGISPEMVVESGIENGLHYIIITAPQPESL